MKKSFLIVILFISLSFVSAEIVQEGNFISLSDRDYVDRSLKLESVSSAKLAVISVDGEQLNVEEGKYYLFSNIELFVNDVMYSNLAGVKSSIKINEFFTLYEDKANQGQYLAVDNNGDEKSLNIKVLSADKAEIIIDGETRQVVEKELVEFKGTKFFVDNILYSRPSSVKGISLGFSIGSVQLKNRPIQVQPRECQDSDGIDYYTKGTASGKHWQEFSGWGYFEKQDYCWERSSSQPSENGDYVIDFNCAFNPRIQEIVLVGSIFKCPNGCSDGSCLKVEQEASEENEESSTIEIEEINRNGFICGSCELENKCYPIGYRINDKFCSDNKNFVEQLSKGKNCQNSFECTSNVCAAGECISESLIRKIIVWFKNFLG